MSGFDNYKRKALENPAVKAEYDALQPEYNLIQAMIDAREQNNSLSYKGYNGSIEYSEEDCCLFGKVIGIKSLISYEGNSVEELENGFVKSVDEYLKDCKEMGVLPEQPYGGSFREL